MTAAQSATAEPAEMPAATEVAAATKATSRRAARDHERSAQRRDRHQCQSRIARAHLLHRKLQHGTLLFRSADPSGGFDGESVSCGAGARCSVGDNPARVE